MYEIHGLKFSFNTTKVVYVAEQLGLEYSYQEVDVSTGANKSPEHLARHPLGKLPTLTHQGEHIFESGAICRYLASIEGSELYPGDGMARARVDQWMDFFSVHLGRWLSSVLFERVFRGQFGMGEPNAETIKEALGFIEKQAAVVDARLGDSAYLAGDALSIADLFAFAYVESTEASDISLAPYPNLARWYEGIKASPAVKRGRGKLFG